MASWLINRTQPLETALPIEPGLADAVGITGWNLPRDNSGRGCRASWHLQAACVLGGFPHSIKRMINRKGRASGLKGRFALHGRSAS